MEFHYYALLASLICEPVPTPVTLEPRYPLAQYLVEADSHGQ